MSLLLLCVGVLWGALTFRIRGGALAGTKIETPGQVSRLIFAVNAALVSWVAVWHLDFWLTALWLAIVWFVGCTLPLGGWIGLGRTSSMPEWQCYLVGTARGVIWTLLPALLLWWGGFPHWWALLVAGACMAGDYWAGRQSGINAGRQLTYRDFPTVGEAITGVVFCAGAALAVS